MASRKVILSLLVVALTAGAIYWSIGAAPPTPATSTAPTTHAATPTLATPTTIPGVKNFAQVSPTLYRGEQPTAEGFAELKKRGIKTVVNLRSFHSDRDQLAGTGLRYASISCKAWHPETEDVVAFLKIMQDPQNHPVFVHCQQGADRTGTMVAVYRMLEQNWSLEDAVKEMQGFGFHPVWTEISEYLKTFSPQEMREKVAKAAAPKVETVP